MSQNNNDMKSPEFLQQELILNMEGVSKPERFVHLLEAWDDMPLFRNRRVSVPSDRITERREFITWSGVEVQIKQTAVEIEETVDGKRVGTGNYRFPGQREENVLNVLRWMATHGHGSISDDSEGDDRTLGLYEMEEWGPLIKVNYTRQIIKNVAKERFNKSMNWKDIGEALQVLAESSLRITRNGYELTCPMIIVAEEANGDVGFRKGTVALHPWISHVALRSQEFQLYFADRMGMPPLVQKLLFLMAFHWLNASTEQPFRISASEWWEQAEGQGSYGPRAGADPELRRMRIFEECKRALKSLDKLNVVNMSKCVVKDVRDGLYCLDKHYEVYVTKDFVERRKAASAETRISRKVPTGQSIATDPRKALSPRTTRKPRTKK